MKPTKRGKKLGTAERKGFTNGEPWTATERDCNAPWSGGRNGSRFRCTLCGYRFKPGDMVRWQYTNDVQGAGGNPLVCTDCDGSKEEIVKEMKARYAEVDGRMWSFCSGE